MRVSEDGWEGTFLHRAEAVCTSHHKGRVSRRASPNLTATHNTFSSIYTKEDQQVRIGMEKVEMKQTHGSSHVSHRSGNSLKHTGHRVWSYAFSVC